MKPFVFIIGIILGLGLAQGQIAPECTYTRERYYPSIWISTPPLLIEDTSLAVYFCSGYPFFYYARRYSSAHMRGAIREAGTPTYGSSYTGSFLVCRGYQCLALYRQNFTNSLVTLHRFMFLKPNTLYTLELLGCYYCCDICRVGERVRFHHSVNITTRPEAPQFQWLSTTQEIQIYFQQDYFTGPAPDGHEVLVWPKNRASHSTATALSHYFPLSTLNATVAGLLPNTEYFLYVRANGTHSASNQGAWVGREVRTRPLDPPMPQLLQYAKRDTAILLKLNLSLVVSGVVSCLVELVSEATGLKITSLQKVTISDRDGSHCLFIEGLVPNQEYRLKLAAVNEAGVSGFTEWVDFTTMSAVVYSTPSDVVGALLLQWTPPTLFDGESLLQYEVTLTPLGVGSAVQMRYILPATQSELNAQGLQEGAEYQVTIETRVDVGLVQPFYSMNITIPVAPVSSAAVVNGVAGAGVTLLIVLVCVAAGVGLLLVVVFLKRRKGGSKTKDATTKERSTLQRNVGDVGNEVTMKANPAYEVVEFDVGEGTDPQRYEVRYHSQEDAVELRDAGGHEEGEGLRDGAGLEYDESRMENANQVFYENITHNN